VLNVSELLLVQKAPYQHPDGGSPCSSPVSFGLQLSVKASLCGAGLCWVVPGVPVGSSGIGLHHRWGAAGVEVAPRSRGTSSCSLEHGR